MLPTAEPPGSETGSINTKQQSVIERLEAKEALRLAALQKRRAGAAEQKDPRESESLFLERFKQGVKGLEDRLSTILQQAKSADARTDPAQGALREQLDGTASALQELDQDVAASSYFLSSYHSRTVQATLAQLRESLASARADAMPKKKFFFSRKGKGGGETAPEAPAQTMPPDAPGDVPASSRTAPSSSTSAKAASPASDVPTYAAGTTLASGRVTTAAAAATTTAAAAATTTAAAAATTTAAAAATTITAAAATTTAAAAATTTAPGAPVLPGCRGLEGRRGEMLVLELNPSERGEVSLSNLEGCHVYVRGCAGAMFIHGLEGCRVFAGPVAGAVHVDGVSGCVFMLASHQLRIHHAHGTDFYIRVRSNPIVEYTSGVRFAPYAYTYSGLDRDLASTDLQEDTGLWQKVDDFRWLRAVASPNWSVLPEAERVPVVDGSSAVPGSSCPPGVGEI